MKRLLTVLPILPLLCSCSLLGTATPTPRCEELDNSYLGWSATAAASAGLAGAIGTGTATTAAMFDDNGGRNATIILGTSGAVLGVLATVAGILAGEYASRYAAECGGPVP